MQKHSLFESSALKRTYSTHCARYLNLKEKFLTAKLGDLQTIEFQNSNGLGRLIFWDTTLEIWKIGYLLHQEAPFFPGHSEHDEAV